MTEKHVSITGIERDPGSVTYYGRVADLTNGTDALVKLFSAHEQVLRVLNQDEINVSWGAAWEAKDGKFSFTIPLLSRIGK